MWQKFRHVTLKFWRQRSPRTPPCGESKSFSRICLHMKFKSKGDLVEFTTPRLISVLQPFIEHELIHLSSEIETGRKSSSCRGLIRKSFHHEYKLGIYSLPSRNQANSSNALGRNHMHDKYSPGSVQSLLHRAPARGQTLQMQARRFKGRYPGDGGTNQRNHRTRQLRCKEMRHRKTPGAVYLWV